MVMVKYKNNLFAVDTLSILVFYYIIDWLFSIDFEKKKSPRFSVGYSSYDDVCQYLKSIRRNQDNSIIFAYLSFFQWVLIKITNQLNVTNYE